MLFNCRSLSETRTGFYDLGSYTSFFAIESKLPKCDKGLRKFLNNYLAQVESVLTCCAALHSRDLEGFLTAMDRGAMDLPWYFKLIPVHLGKM